jgi:hypothetical protein
MISTGYSRSSSRPSDESHRSDSSTSLEPPPDELEALDELEEILKERRPMSGAATSAASLSHHSGYRDRNAVKPPENTKRHISTSVPRNRIGNYIEFKHNSEENREILN